MAFSSLTETRKSVMGTARRPLSALDISELLTEFAIDTRANILNPPHDVTAQLILSEIRSRHISKQEEQRWAYVPWNGSDKKINLWELFNFLICHVDDHDIPIPGAYLPVDQTRDMIDHVLSYSERMQRALTIPEQYDIALNIADNYPTAGAILAHSASRAIGRNRETRAGDKLTFTFDEMRQWSRAVARFDDGMHRETPGDTYHYWACFTMGMASKSLEEDERIAAILCRSLFFHGAQLMNSARNVVTANKGSLLYLHEEVDRLGLETGIEVYEGIS